MTIHTNTSLQTLESPLFTAMEAAAYLKVSRSTVFELVKRGALTTVRFGTALRFTKRDLDDLIASKRKEQISYRASRGRGMS